jgi:hypothetical protein
MVPVAPPPPSLPHQRGRYRAVVGAKSSSTVEPHLPLDGRGWEGVSDGPSVGTPKPCGSSWVPACAGMTSRLWRLWCRQRKRLVPKRHPLTCHSSVALMAFFAQIAPLERFVPAGRSEVPHQGGGVAPLLELDPVQPTGQHLPLDGGGWEGVIHGHSVLWNTATVQLWPYLGIGAGMTPSMSRRWGPPIAASGGSGFHYA